MDALHETAIALLIERQECPDDDRRELLTEGMVKCLTAIALRPLWRRCLKRVGVHSFERKTRRCVYPNGRTVPILAWRVEGEAEHTSHAALVEEAERLYSREVRKLGLNHER